LNNDFVHGQSAAFAERVIAEAGSDPSAQVDRAWWLALAREPSASERSAALAHLASQRGNLGAAANPDTAGATAEADLHKRALASLCHVLFNTNEFIYVD